MLLVARLGAGHSAWHFQGSVRYLSSGIGLVFDSELSSSWLKARLASGLEFQLGTPLGARLRPDQVWDSARLCLAPDSALSETLIGIWARCSARCSTRTRLGLTRGFPSGLRARLEARFRFDSGLGSGLGLSGPSLDTQPVPPTTPSRNVTVPSTTPSSNVPFPSTHRPVTPLSRLPHHPVTPLSRLPHRPVTSLSRLPTVQ